MSTEIKKLLQTSFSFRLVDKVIDKLLRTVEKDADFVFRSSSAYKGTTETRKTKSKKPPILGLPQIVRTVQKHPYGR